MSDAKSGWLPLALRPFLPASTVALRPRALVLLVVGWMLSPLCWWNDLLINLPVAWGLASVARWIEPAWFAPGLVVGYWLSNVLGIVLLQSGALALVQSPATPRDRRREWLIGLATSTAYTLAVVFLVRLGWLPSPIPAMPS
jgi:hypothetical protein